MVSNALFGESIVVEGFALDNGYIQPKKRDLTEVGILAVALAIAENVLVGCRWRRRTDSCRLGPWSRP